MTWVEYRRVRDHIAEEWTGSRREELRDLVRMQVALRRTAPPGQPAREIPRLQPHCILYDESARRCSVYAARPFHCRAYGFGGECPLVRLRDGTRAMDAGVDVRALGRRVLAENEPCEHGGRRIEADRTKPIEFWFALETCGWDETMDPDDPAFIGRRTDAP